MATSRLGRLILSTFTPGALGVGIHPARGGRILTPLDVRTSLGSKARAARWPPLSSGHFSTCEHTNPDLGFCAGVGRQTTLSWQCCVTIGRPRSATTEQLGQHRIRQRLLSLGVVRSAVASRHVTQHYSLISSLTHVGQALGRKTSDPS